MKIRKPQNLDPANLYNNLSLVSGRKGGAKCDFVVGGGHKGGLGGGKCMLKKALLLGSKVT